MLYGFGVTFSTHSHPCCIVIVTIFVVRNFRTALVERCTSKFFLHLLELFAFYCLNYVLEHSDNFPQSADVIQVIVTNQSHVNVAFIQLLFKSPCLVCVYTSFMYVFYQSYAANFAESTFFIMAQIYGVAVSPGSLSDASSSVFVAVTFALLRFCFAAWTAVCGSVFHSVV